jgi:hypothetical protein
MGSPSKAEKVSGTIIYLLFAFGIVKSLPIREISKLVVYLAANVILNSSI